WTQVSFFDLLYLEAQELGAALLLAGILLQGLQRFLRAAPLGYFLAKLFAQGEQFGVAIKEVNMLFRSQQAHMLALTVNVNQPACNLLEHLLRVDATIDARHGATGAENVAREDQLPIFRQDIVLVQEGRQRDQGVGALGIGVQGLRMPALGMLEFLEHRSRAVAHGGERWSFHLSPLVAYRWQGLNREDPLDAGAFASRAHKLGPDFATEQGVHSVNNDRLARACLACKDIKQAMQADM